ncbi:alpha/beta hydrolase [Altericista sp. CCNU0014]|uniref:alpha/beta hydrolase n=1 Tax=Altericista sp. CCNU0014 TaxID=3082949 RepID=UPI00384D855F
MATLAGFVLGIAMGFGEPAVAAQNILLKYGYLKIDIPVSALETYANTGTAEPALKPYLDLLTSRQQTQIRQFLQFKLPITPEIAQHILQEPNVNEFLSLYVEDILQPVSAQQGKGTGALKTAILNSAATFNSLSILQVLQQFSSDTIEVNTSLALRALQESRTLHTITQTLAKNLEDMTAAAAATEALPAAGIDLRQPGIFTHTFQTLTLTDPRRKRRFAVDLYVPNAKKTVPLILIENGHGAQRHYFDFLAQHLASHGFAVAIPDHPGSNYQQQQKFITQKASTIFVAQEFVDRPLDDTYLLDELERLNSSKFQNRLNTSNVGVLGYSLGGTTALSLAGATFNFDRLTRDCGRNRNRWNLSSVFQCRALELPRKSYALRDERVKAAFIFVSFGSSLYGESGLSQVRIPVFVQALVEDIFTPLTIEQLPTFAGLQSSSKYLSIISGFPHVTAKSVLRTYVEAHNASSLPTANLTSRSQPVARLSLEEKGMRKTLNPFSLAFFQLHLAQNNQYLPYLQAAYAKAFSEGSSYDVSFVRSLLPKQVESLQNLQHHISGLVSASN